MTTNNYPGIGYNNKGKDFNFYKSFSITETSFGGNSVDGYQPNTIITFANYGIMLTNETSGQIVEFSFNGNHVHGVLNGTSTSTTRILTFLNRQVSCIWFRLQSGSAGPATITVTAW